MTRIRTISPFNKKFIPIFEENITKYGEAYKKTIIPDIFFWKFCDESVFSHDCAKYRIGKIENKEGIAYCLGCEKDLKTPYKHIIFAIKLATFNK